MKYLKYVFLSLTLLTSAYAQVTEEQIKQGQTYLENQQFVEARDFYEELVKSDYKSYKAHFGLGLSLFNLGDLTAARFEFTQLVQLDSKEMVGFYNLGIVQARQGFFDEALFNWQRAYDVGRVANVDSKELLDILLTLGDVQTQRQQYDGAVRTYQSALELFPQDPKLMLLAAQSLYNRSQGASKSVADTAMSLNYAYEALKLDPNNPEIISTIADIYASQSLTDRALRELERAQIAMQDPEAQSVLLGKKGEILANQGKTQEALAAYAQASQRNNTDDYQYATLLMQVGRYVDAATILKELVQQVRTPEVLVTYAEALEGSGQYLQAYYTADAALKMNPAPEGFIKNNAIFVAGRALYRGKQFPLAQKTLSTIKNPTAEILVWQGLAAYASKDNAAAQKAFEGAIALDPQNAVAAANLGAVYVATSRYPEAEMLLKKVVKATAKNAEAWFNLGLSLRAQNRPVEAKMAFEKALGLGYTKAKGVVAL